MSGRTPISKTFEVDFIPDILVSFLWSGVVPEPDPCGDDKLAQAASALRPITGNQVFSSLVQAFPCLAEIKRENCFWGSRHSPPAEAGRDLPVSRLKQLVCC
jgi:hypothetical protein